MNFYWRQTIVGLLRYAAASMPEMRERSVEASEHLDETLTIPWLERAFSLFEEATLRSHDPVYVTGAYYTMRALDEVATFEERSGAAIESSARKAAGGHTRLTGRSIPRDEVSTEVEKGMFDLFDRLRRGATLEEALALFPAFGDEESSEE